MSKLDSSTSGWIRRGLGPLLLALAFLGLTTWSWRKWPDLLLDFGRELYIPWQITEGQVLYRDLACLFGPLSPYFHAFLFRLFGVSFATLIFSNLVILAGLLALVYQSLARNCDRLTAFSGVLLWLLVFGFSQYGAAGNFNFVAPYSHQATHGLALALVMIYGLERFGHTHRLSWAGLAGLCLGLGFLTKAETEVAALGAAAVSFLTLILRERPLLAPTRKALWLFPLSFAMPLLGFFLYFVRLMPWDQALRAVAGAWIVLLSRPVAQSYFYQKSLGLVDFSGNLIWLLKMTGWTAGWIGLAVLLDQGLKKRVAHYLVLAGFFLALGGFSDQLNWWELPRCFLLTTLAAFIAFALLFYRHRRDSALARRYSNLLVWSALALALRAKMLFFVRVYDYGFYLALPASLILVVVLVWLIPHGLAARGAAGKLFRNLCLLMLVFGALDYLRFSQFFYRAKTLPIGAQGDLILGYNRELQPRDALAAEALAWIQKQTPPDATLVALPEGVMLNYLSRRKNPAPFLNFTPFETMVYGEDTMVKSFQAHPPDYVLLVHKRDQEDYGVGFFGQDPNYGRIIMDWIGRHYQPVALFGSMPLRDERSGILILKRQP